MKLSQILQGIECQKINFLDVDIEYLSNSTIDIRENTLYFCISGTNVDGHQFANMAVNKGSVALVVEKPLNIDVPQIVVQNVRKSIGIMASNFYQNPRKSFGLIGVTGTNGKTTTTYMIKSILETAGFRVGVIGTIGVVVGDKTLKATLTTPDPIQLHQIFALMREEGADYVVMEVSAHAIALDKMAGVVCDVGILTNITQDHLDFFGDMDKYKETKLKFLSDEFCKTKVINIDDDIILDTFLSGRISNAVTFGLDNPSDVFAIKINYSMLGTTYFLNLCDNVGAVNTRLIGEFNLYNAMGAATACLMLGVDTESIFLGLSTCDFVPGRCNIIPLKNGAYAVIDYAHTPDGLQKILTSIRQICKSRLYCLFGCGGNRDATKRPIMGQISAKFADFTVITSDNPRLEDPDSIIEQIKEGVTGITDQYICIQNRKEAILNTINSLSSGDVLVIAGKGAEDYMDIAGKKIPYSDFDCLQQAKK